MEEDKGEALPGVSHRFIICRTWTLADFELMYAPLERDRYWMGWPKGGVQRSLETIKILDFVGSTRKYLDRPKKIHLHRIESFLVYLVSHPMNSTQVFVFPPKVPRLAPLLLIPLLHRPTAHERSRAGVASRA